MPERRFPPPWTVEDTDACFIVRDHNGQARAYVYCEEEPGRRSAAHLLTRDEARRIAAKHRQAAGPVESLRIATNLRLLNKQLAPAARTDFALNDFVGPTVEGGHAGAKRAPGGKWSGQRWTKAITRSMSPGASLTKIPCCRSSSSMHAVWFVGTFDHSTLALFTMAAPMMFVNMFTMPPGTWARA
jgi:hypothetical protein